MTYDNIDHSGKKDRTDTKPWWVVSLIITGFLVLLVFNFYFLHHNMEYVKKLKAENKALHST